jgi:hypothetical protein
VKSKIAPDIQPPSAMPNSVAISTMPVRPGDSKSDVGLVRHALARDRFVGGDVVGQRGQ